MIYNYDFEAKRQTPSLWYIFKRHIYPDTELILISLEEFSVLISLKVWESRRTALSKLVIYTLSIGSELVSELLHEDNKTCMGDPLNLRN